METASRGHSFKPSCDGEEKHKATAGGGNHSAALLPPVLRSKPHSLTCHRGLIPIMPNPHLFHRISPVNFLPSQQGRQLCAFTLHDPLSLTGCPILKGLCHDAVGQLDSHSAAWEPKSPGSVECSAADEDTGSTAWGNAGMFYSGIASELNQQSLY